MSFERQQSPGKSSETVAARPDRAITRPPHAENPLLDRQRALGNQAVQRLLLSGALQAKLRVGPPNDAYEREADRVADTVMRMPEPEVQRQRTEESEEEEEGIRTETLADGITPLVQRQTEAPPEEEEEEQLPQAEPAPGEVQPLVQRQEAEPAEEEEEEEEPQAVQPKAKGAGITHVREATLVQRLRSPSGGSPLSSGVRSFFERRFGYDFSEVRIHEAQQERADAASLDARAFTFGKHIWLGQGESATDSRLMAHELTHVVQQDAGVRRRPLNVSPVSPRIQRQFGFLKDRALGKLAQWARSVPGFDLLTVILEKDPITDQPVERNAINLTRGVLGLLGDAGIAMFENLEKSGAIARAFEWLKVEISKLNLTWDTIKGLFRAAWEAIDPEDIIIFPRALEKLRQIFGPPLARLRDFAFAAGRKILEFIFEGALSLAGGFGTRVLGIVRRAGALFTSIINDPIKFLGNLITALRGGFERFADNILDHLRTGLLQWLLGALSGAGLTLPAKWDLKGFVSIIVQVLGLSYDKSVRPRLIKLIGVRGVALIEGVFDFVKTLVTGGLSAAWEKVLEYAENLQEMVIGAIRDWVVKSVVGAAITKLITMFNPVGAVIQGIMTIYRTIEFFIDKAQEIAALANAVFESIANIAAGNVGAAISYVERTMARALPVIIGFLARLIGLGNISGQIRSFIERVQAMVDKAIDKVVDFIVKRVKGLLADRQQPGQTAPTTTPEDTPAAAAVKTAALAEVQTKSQGKNLRAIEDYRDILAEVYTKYSQQGLKGIAATADPGLDTITVSATASVPSTVTIRWADVFPATPADSTEREKLKRLLAQFRSEGRGAINTYAALAVNGRRIADARNAGDHAEMELLGGASRPRPEWKAALEEADKVASAKGSAEFTLLINRSPCGSRCTPQLSTWLTENRTRHQNVRFILAATGNYAPVITRKELELHLEAWSIETDRPLKVPLRDISDKDLKRIFEEVLGPLRSTTGVREEDATSLDNLRQLQGATWELHRLDVGATGWAAELLERRIQLLRDEASAAARRKLQQTGKVGNP